MQILFKYIRVQLIDQGSSHSMIRTKSTNNTTGYHTIQENTKTQANTGVNISKQWHRGTPGHIEQHPNNTYPYFTVRLSAAQ